MIFDLRTIYAMTAVACFVLGLIQGAAFLSGRFERWLGWWSASNLIIGTATFLIALRNVAPDPLSIQAGNALTIVGCLLLPATMHVFAGGQVRIMSLVCLTTLLVLPCVVVYTDQSATMQRVAYGSVMGALFDLMVALQTWHLYREQKLQSARLAAVLFAVTATIYATRAGLSLVGDLGERDLFGSGNALHSWIGLSSMMFLALRSSVIMLMAAERAGNQLRAAAFRDPLTGVFNRGGLLQYFRAPVVKPFALLLVDLDHFKQLNDTAGHAAGDRVLQAFAAAARTAVSADDLIARHGGDEFVIVLKQQRIEEAMAVAEQIRLQFALSLAQLAEKLPVRPTLSIGIAAHASGPADLDALLQRADSALYRRKRKGRDGVSAWRDDRNAA